MELDLPYYLPATVDTRVYWVTPDNFSMEGSFEFTLLRDERGAALSIPTLGTSMDPQYAEQAAWVRTTFPLARKLRPSAWAFDRDSATIVEAKLKSLGRLHEWDVLTDHPEVVPDVMPLRPVGIESEELAWELLALPELDKATVEKCRLWVARDKKIFAWCCAYLRGQEGPQPSAWFRGVTGKGVGAAPFKLDPENRPIEGFRLNEAQLKHLVEESVCLPEEMLRRFSARWVF